MRRDSQTKLKELVATARKEHNELLRSFHEFQREFFTQTQKIDLLISLLASIRIPKQRRKNEK